MIKYLLPLELPGSIYTVASKINYTWHKSIEGCAAIWGLVVETSIFFSGPLVKLTNWIWLQHFIAGAPLHQGGDNSQSTIQLSNYVNLCLCILLIDTTGKTKRKSHLCWCVLSFTFRLTIPLIASHPKFCWKFQQVTSLLWPPWATSFVTWQEITMTHKAHFLT